VDLETILLKAFATQPEDRYQTAAEMAEDLRLFAGNQAIRSKRPARRNSLSAGSAGTRSGRPV